MLTVDLRPRPVTNTIGFRMSRGKVTLRKQGEMKLFAGDMVLGDMVHRLANKKDRSGKAIVLAATS